MSVPADLFGSAYLDAESFRAAAALFGAGMSLAADYPATTDGNEALNRVLQAASRIIDNFTGRNYSPANKTERHALDTKSWQIRVNNPPVVEVVSCVIRYAVDGTIAVQPSNVYINNQKGYLEITRFLDDGLTLVAAAIGTEISGPQVEIVYKSLQSVPPNVKLACGYQAAHMINSGFVDKTLPPNFGKLDLGGLAVNNKKGYRSQEEMRAGALSPEAVQALQSEIRFSVS